MKLIQTLILSQSLKILSISPHQSDKIAYVIYASALRQVKTFTLKLPGFLLARQAAREDSPLSTLFTLFILLTACGEDDGNNVSGPVVVSQLGDNFSVNVDLDNGPEGTHAQQSIPMTCGILVRVQSGDDSNPIPNI